MAEDPGWPELVEFLTVAGLKDGPLERVLVQLTAEDVTSIGVLRSCFSALAPKLKAGARTCIRDALAATPALLLPVAFNVVVSFKQQEATMRLALPDEDYVGKMVKHLLPQLDMMAAQNLSGAFKTTGLSFDGAQLALDKALREQRVPQGSVLTAFVEEMNPVHALASKKAKVRRCSSRYPSPSHHHLSPPRRRRSRAARKRT